MQTKWQIGMVIGAAVLATLAIGVVQTRAGKEIPDLTGTWTLDAARSDLLGGRDRSGFRRRVPALPAILRITQGKKALEFADSAGSPFLEVAIGAESTAPSDEPGNLNGDVRRLTGRWEDGTLKVERVGFRGGVMIQKYRLADQGKVLEVRLERKRSGDDAGRGRGRMGTSRRWGPGGGVKLVYRRSA
jgi:hypothetical protein